MYPLEAVQELEKKLPNLTSQDIEDLEAYAKSSSSIDIRESMTVLQEMIMGLLRDYGDGTGIFTFLGHEGNVITTVKLIDGCIVSLTPLAELMRKLRLRRDEEKEKFDVLMEYLSGEEDDNEIVDYDAETIAMMRKIMDHL
jgi:hypothetical protein